MASHHRKLLYQPLTDLGPFCQVYCDNVEKSNGTCPLSCFNICPPDSCKQIIYLLSPPPPPLPPPPLTPTIILTKAPKVSLLLTASLAVLATAFFIFTCYTLYRFYSVWSKSRHPQRRRPEAGGGPDLDLDLLDEDDDPVVDHPIWYIRTIGLQPSVINAIAIVNYKKADGLVEGSDCAVCLSEFEEDETLRLLPKCSHAFHIPCIDTWLTSHTNCPLCRAGIVVAEEPAAHDSGRAEEVETEDDGSGRSQIGPGVSENVEGGDLKVDIGVLEIEMELDGVQVQEQVQGVRRSVSMDSISASVISAAVANALSDNNREKQKECCKDEEEAGWRSVQVGSSSIKRSASCSAKLFLSRHSSRSRSMNRS